MSKKIELRYDLLLIEMAPPVEGSYFTEGTKEFKGVVKYVGPAVSYAEVGDEVYFEEYDHATVVIEGVQYVKCREEAIICVIK